MGYGNNKFMIAILTMVCLSTLFFSALSIHSSYELNHNLNIQKEHPFEVSEAIYKIRGYNAVSQIRLNRLVMYNTEADVAIVIEAIENQYDKVTENLKVIQEKYLGPETEVEELKSTYEELHQKKLEFLKKAAGLTHKEVENYIQAELEPYYQQIEIITETLLTFAKGTTERLTQESQGILSRSIFFSILFFSLLVCICIMLYREYMQRIKERSFRDFLFETLAGNIDNVFMIYNVTHSRMEYVFSNSERVLGIKDIKIAENPVLFFDYWESGGKDECREMFAEHNIFSRIDKEVKYRNPVSGMENWILFSFQPIIDESGEARYIVSVTDLTEAKKNQQALHDALVNAQNASLAKSEFLSRMSHEIRTPMNAIIGMTTIAASSIEEKNRLEDCLTKISGASKHLLLLINDILDMSKIESGKMSIQKEPFSIVELIKNLTSIIYAQAKAKGLDFNVVIQSMDHESLIGDSLRLNQVLLNIMSNAIKYTETGGKVKLTVQEIRHRKSNSLSLRFTVSDTGRGMSEEFLEKLYTPFEQESRDGDFRTGSTGIGLAITKNIVTLMGGTIRVDSILGEGSTFTVEIPFEPEQEAAKNYAYDLELDHLKVLVADDDRDTCEHVTLLLKRMKIEAEWVLQAETAVAKAIQAFDAGDSYDVLFIDWKMNDIDGVEATRRIRKKVGPDVLIIIISAYDWTEIEEEARLAGANAFISKPMMESTIYNTLLTNVRRPMKSAVKVLTEMEAGRKFSGKRFLVAEDNEINMEIAVELLQAAGATVDAVYNGKDAYQKFRDSVEGTYDLILMDIQMPQMDGYETTGEIRRLERQDARAVPIIAMTANAFTEDIMYSLEAGMNAHLSKPIEINVFYDTIKKYLF